MRQRTEVQEVLQAHGQPIEGARSRDTLTRIARDCETDMAEIFRQTGIEDPNVIREGRYLTCGSLRAAGRKCPCAARPPAVKANACP